MTYLYDARLLGVTPYLKDGSQNGFHRYLSDTEVASLQTGFIISYMCFSPVFGYLGDRFIRKRIMGVGVILWSLFTAAGSFAPVSVIVTVCVCVGGCVLVCVFK